MQGVTPGIEGDAKTNLHPCLQGAFDHVGHKHMPTQFITHGCKCVLFDPQSLKIFYQHKKNELPSV